MKKIYLTFVVFLISQLLHSQGYTYAPESFESDVWITASSSSNVISAETGNWTVAKNNVRSDATTAQDGSYSLLFATKTNALMSPQLEKGAGILTYHIIKPSGGSRVVMVSTSTDKVNWSNAVDSIVVPSAWTLRRVEINDPAVRYIRFSTNSNGSVYIDNVNITTGGSAEVSVTTAEPTDITQTTAVAGGVVATEENGILSRGVCYSTSQFPDVNSDKVEAAGTTGEFSVALTNLMPGTVYYVKAYAITESGVNYGEEVNFTTRPGDNPVAYWLQDFNDVSQMPSSNPETPLAIDVSGQGEWIYKGAYKGTNALYIQDGSPCNLRMVKNGSYVITPLLEDGVTTVSFYEGRGGRTLTIYTSEDGGEHWSLLSEIETVKVTANVIEVNSLTVNRVKIANESGGDADIDNLSVRVFPSGITPGVSTTAVSNVGKNTALTGGTITDNGSKTVVNRGVCWSLTPNPILDDNVIEATEVADNFTISLTGLPAGKMIYTRAFATSRAGTGYGNEISFTTLSATIPVVATTIVATWTGETAWSGGVIADNGGAPVAMKGVCWDINNNPTIENNKTIENVDESVFRSLIKGLTPNTTYYYRAYATNEAGTGYGEVSSFTTGSVSMPVVSTDVVTGILSYRADGGGNITHSGNAPVVYGLCWNNSGNPTIDDTKTVQSDVESGVFTSLMGNLLGNTSYYVRAYATNSVGTAYGQEVTFTTTATLNVYVSPAGNDETGDGSATNPFYSLQKAVDLVSAGDTIFMLGGTYNYAARININKSGTADGGKICVFAPVGERALLDFSSMSVHSDNQGIRLTGSYWHFYGLDIKGAGDNGMLIERNKPVGGNFSDILNRTDEAHHNIMEFCSFYDNKDTGLQLKNMAEYNRIINCDSYNNRDLEDGNADGFAPKLTVGTGNYFYGCRAWNNSDDGWDGLLTATENGFPDDMTTIIENCWSFANGFLKDGSEGRGNGNGFKLGGSGNHDQRHNMMLIRCLAFDNLMKGFDQNHNVGNMTLINCSGYARKYLANKNHYTYKIDGTILAPGKELTLINSLAVCDGLAADKSAYAPCRITGGVQLTCDFMTSASDFVSIDTIGTRAPRKADGSLPDVTFMQIAPGNTKLINKGTVSDGISYNGTLPDLGCFETGEGGPVDLFFNPLNEQDIIVFPQPAVDRFTVELPGSGANDEIRLNIISLRGTIVYSNTFNGNAFTVECGHLTSGFYVVYVVNTTTGEKYTSKLILK